MADTEAFISELIDSDVTVGEIRHEYDPVAARDYYLRTRELKGRKKGAEDAPVGRAASTKTFNSRQSAQNQAEAQRKALRAQAEKRRKAVEARVTQLKARLAALEKLLDQLTMEAKKRSGIDTKPNAKAPAKSSSKGSDKPLTAAQKREAAKKAKERRDKEAPKTPNDEAKALEAKITNVKERIEKMKKQIADAKRKPPTRSSSKAQSSRQTATIRR